MRHPKVIDSVWYTPFFSGDVSLPADLKLCIGFVAVKSGPSNKNWKCYMGLGLGMDEATDAELIAISGTKVIKRVALAHFPELEPRDFIW